MQNKVFITEPPPFLIMRNHIIKWPVPSPTMEMGNGVVRRWVGRVADRRGLFGVRTSYCRRHRRRCLFVVAGRGREMKRHFVISHVVSSPESIQEFFFSLAPFTFARAGEVGLPLECVTA